MIVPVSGIICVHRMYADTLRHLSDIMRTHHIYQYYCILRVGVVVVCAYAVVVVVVYGYGW